LATSAEQLEHELITRPDQVMVVAGIGVSLATCGNNPCASWKGLLQHGLQRCEEVCGTPPTILKAYHEILSDPTAPAHALISVGQFITDELNDRRPGVFGRWLSDSIGRITPTDTKLVRTLASLDVKLATTNYDNTMEDGTSRFPITWRDRARATIFFRESTQDVLHLHGHYRQADSVILGARSYSEICRDEYAQTALRGWMIYGTLFFVGCGAGLKDPNFGALLEWAEGILRECHHSHFILVRSAEVDDWRERLKGMLIDPISYGREYDDLVPFLEALAQRVKQKRAREPLSLLSASQTSFDAKWEQLERTREDLPLLEYFQRSRILAAELWRAGGLRRAAMAFSGRLTSRGEPLLVRDYVEFALDAVEWLLDDDLPSLAATHLDEIRKRLGGTDISAQHLTRFQQLRVRCMDALCAYTETLRAIEEALPHANDDERARLEAERSEIHFLQGNFAQAIADRK
jgi:hypothetical protein